MKFPLSVILRGVDQITGPLAKGKQGLTQFGDAASKIGTRLTLGLTTPIVGLGAKILHTSAVYEEAMNNVAVLTNATADEMAELDALALRMGDTTRHAATQSAIALAVMGDAGFRARDSIRDLPHIADLATAAKKRLGDAAEITTGFMAGFNFQAHQTQRVNDVLSRTFSSTRSSLDTLWQGYQRVGPTAQEAGLVFEDLIATLGEMSDAGIPARRQGTVLEEVLRSLISPSTSAMERFVELGIAQRDLFQEDGRMRGIVELLEVLENRGAGAGDMMELFGQAAGPTMQILLSRGSDGLRALREDLLAAEGTTRQLAEIQNRGAVPATQALSAAIENLQLRIGESGLLEDFTSLVNTATGWIRETREANPETFRWATNLALVGAALGPVIFLAGQTALAIGAVTTMVKGLTVAIMANPIGFAIGAIIAGLVLLEAKTGWISSAWEWSMEKISLGAQKAAEWVSSAMSWIRESADAALGWVSDRVQSLLSMLPEGLRNRLGLGSTAEMRAALGAEDADAAAGLAAERLVGRVERTERLERREHTLRISSDGLPPGMRLDVEGPGGLDLDLDLGHQMAGAL